LYVGSGSTIYKVVDQTLATPVWRLRNFYCIKSCKKQKLLFLVKNATIFWFVFDSWYDGKFVYRQWNATEKQIDISSLPTGLYVF
jgi:hypothetical protein